MLLRSRYGDLQRVNWLYTWSRRNSKTNRSDTVNYQSIKGLVEATGFAKEDLCLGCITGQYPTPLAQKIADRMKEKFLGGYKETGRLYEMENEILSA